MFFQHFCSVNAVLLDLQGSYSSLGKRPPRLRCTSKRNWGEKWSKIQEIVKTEFCRIKEQTAEVHYLKHNAAIILERLIRNMNK